MVPTFEAAGRDAFDRTVYTAWCPDVPSLARLRFPVDGPVVVFLVLDTPDLPTDDDLLAIAIALLQQRAIYLIAWGPACQRMESAFHLADDRRDPEGQLPTVVTTLPANEPLEKALSFATHSAAPPEECQTLLAIFVGNVSWYNVAQEFFEEELR